MARPKKEKEEVNDVRGVDVVVTEWVPDKDNVVAPRPIVKAQ